MANGNWECGTDCLGSFVLTDIPKTALIAGSTRNLTKLTIEGYEKIADKVCDGVLFAGEPGRRKMNPVFNHSQIANFVKTAKPENGNQLTETLDLVMRQRPPYAQRSIFIGGGHEADESASDGGYSEDDETWASNKHTYFGDPQITDRWRISVLSFFSFIVFFLPCSSGLMSPQPSTGKSKVHRRASQNQVFECMLCFCFDFLCICLSVVKRLN